jgi:hypothetical protein
MELSVTNTLALFETTKSERETFALRMVQEIKEGNIDPLKVHMQVKSTEHLLDMLKDNPEYRALLLEQAEKNGKKFEMYNSEFQVKEAGTKWDYSKCDDAVYTELEKELAGIQSKIKERQKFLQTIPESGIADPVNGNMIYRASKSSTTIVQCSLK